MKTELTIDEGNLLELRGIKIASKWVETRDAVGVYDAPIFSLSDLIEMLPKAIKDDWDIEYKLDIYTRPHRKDCWVVQYIYSPKSIRYKETAEELIDALFELVLNLHNDGLLKQTNNANK